MEYANGGRDYRLGIKIPEYMQELGLHDVNVRVNDRVKFTNPFYITFTGIYQLLSSIGI
jgi:hypothetical protein